MDKLFKKEEIAEAIEMALNTKCNDITVMLDRVNSNDVPITLLFGYRNKSRKVFDILIEDYSGEFSGDDHYWDVKFLRDNISAVAEEFSNKDFNKA